MLFNRRYLKIISYFGRLIVNVIFWEIILQKIGLGVLSRQTSERRYRGTAERFRALALQMGGVMIKVGQFLSSRVDVLPKYITDVLSTLQDEVTPEEFEPIKTIIEQELKNELGSLFETFDSEALAAASLGQVHRAMLFDGSKVVVKVQRPDIEELVRIDLSALKTVVGWLKHWKTVSRRADVEALYEEFSKILWEELDYLSEAENARKFAEIFADDDGVRIPQVYSELSTRRVLTLEDVWFIKITDYEAITKAGVDRHDVAERLLNTYLRQIFNEYYFHADPHPGNLFVEPPGDEHDWRLVFVDFGMVGRVTPGIRDAGKEAVLALITRDAIRMTNAAVIAGLLLPGTDFDLLVGAINKVFDRFWGLSMEELTNLDTTEMVEFLDDLRDVLFDMPFQMPENLIYLGRCIAILSGMCTGLSPKFNVFSSLVPFGQELIKEEVGEDGWEFLKKETKDLAGKFINIPRRLDQLLTKLEKGELTVTTRTSLEQSQQLSRLVSTINRFSLTVVFASFALSGTLLYINEQTDLGYAGWGISLFFLLLAGLKRK